MKTFKFAALSLFIALTLLTSLTVVHVAWAKPDKDQEGGDNKILVTGVPMGDAVQVLPMGATMGGKGNIPDNNGIATAYAPLNKVSQVYLWDQTRGYILIATVMPVSTWPDTVVSAAAHP
jgi:hypothetical protein